MDLFPASRPSSATDDQVAALGQHPPLAQQQSPPAAAGQLQLSMRPPRPPMPSTRSPSPQLFPQPHRQRHRSSSLFAPVSAGNSNTSSGGGGGAWMQQFARPRQQRRPEQRSIVSFLRHESGRRTSAAPPGSLVESESDPFFEREVLAAGSQTALASEEGGCGRGALPRGSMAADNSLRVPQSREDAASMRSGRMSPGSLCAGLLDRHQRRACHLSRRIAHEAVVLMRRFAIHDVRELALLLRAYSRELDRYHAYHHLLQHDDLDHASPHALNTSNPFQSFPSSRCRSPSLPSAMQRQGRSNDSSLAGGVAAATLFQSPQPQQQQQRQNFHPSARPSVSTGGNASALASNSHSLDAFSSDSSFRHFTSWKLAVQQAREVRGSRLPGRGGGRGGAGGGSGGKAPAAQEAAETIFSEDAPERDDWAEIVLDAASVSTPQQLADAAYVRRMGRVMPWLKGAIAVINLATAMVMTFRVAFQVPVTQLTYALEVLLLDLPQIAFALLSLVAVLDIKGVPLVHFPTSARRYLSSYAFALDAVGMLPLEVIGIGIGDRCTRFTAVCGFVAPSWRLNKLLLARAALPRLSGFLDHAAFTFGIHPSVGRLIFAWALVLLTSHAAACAANALISSDPSLAVRWFKVPNYLQESSVFRYAQSTDFATKTIVGFLKGEPFNVPDAVLLMILVVSLFGVFIVSMLIAASALFLERNSSSNQFAATLDALFAEIDYRGFPLDLRNDAVAHFRHVFRTTNTSDDAETALADLPKSLQIRVLAHVGVEMLRRVPLLKGESKNQRFAICLAMSLVPLVLAPHTIVFRKGDVGDSMGFVTHGSLGVVRETFESNPSSAEEVLFVLKSGSVYGEIALILGVRRTATVASLGRHTNLLVLRKPNFMQIAADFPSAARRMTLEAHARLALLNTSGGTGNVKEERMRQLTKVIERGLRRSYFAKWRKFASDSPGIRAAILDLSAAADAIDAAAASPLIAPQTLEHAPYDANTSSRSPGHDAAFRIAEPSPSPGPRAAAATSSTHTDEDAPMPEFIQPLDATAVARSPRDESPAATPSPLSSQEPCDNGPIFPMLAAAVAANTKDGGAATARCGLDAYTVSSVGAARHVVAPPSLQWPRRLSANRPQQQEGADGAGPEANDLWAAVSDRELARELAASAATTKAMPEFVSSSDRTAGVNNAGAVAATDGEESNSDDDDDDDDDDDEPAAAALALEAEINAEAVAFSASTSIADASPTVLLQQVHDDALVQLRNLAALLPVALRSGELMLGGRVRRTYVARVCSLLSKSMAKFNTPTTRDLAALFHAHADAIMRQYAITDSEALSGSLFVGAATTAAGASMNAEVMATALREGGASATPRVSLVPSMVSRRSTIGGGPPAMLEDACFSFRQYPSWRIALQRHREEARFAAIRQRWLQATDSIFTDIAPDRPDLAELHIADGGERFGTDQQKRHSRHVEWFQRHRMRILVLFSLVQVVAFATISFRAAFGHTYSVGGYVSELLFLDLPLVLIALSQALRFEEVQGVVNVDYRRSARRYFTSLGFAIDLLGALPLEIVGRGLRDHCHPLDALITGAVGCEGPHFLNPLWRLNKLLLCRRVAADLAQWVELLSHRFGIAPSLARVLTNFLAFCAACHLSTCGAALFIHITPSLGRTWILDTTNFFSRTTFARYLVLTDWSTKSLVSFWKGEPFNNSDGVTLYILLVSFVGLLLVSAFIGSVISFQARVSAASTASRRIDEAIDDANRRGLPHDLVLDIVTYQWHMFDTSAIDTDFDSALGELPKSLQIRILAHVGEDLVRRVPLLAPEASNRAFVMCLTLSLRSQVLAPRTVLFRKGHEGDSMAFVVHGALGVIAERPRGSRERSPRTYQMDKNNDDDDDDVDGENDEERYFRHSHDDDQGTAFGEDPSVLSRGLGDDRSPPTQGRHYRHHRVLFVLRSGCYVGEMALILGVRRTATVASLGRHTNLLVLRKPNFMQIAADFPSAARRMTLEAHARLAALHLATGDVRAERGRVLGLTTENCIRREWFQLWREVVVQRRLRTEGQTARRIQQVRVRQPPRLSVTQPLFPPPQVLLPQQPSVEVRRRSHTRCGNGSGASSNDNDDDGDGSGSVDGVGGEVAQIGDRRGDGADAAADMGDITSAHFDWSFDPQPF